MPRTQFVAHEDRQIVLMDFTHIRELDQALDPPASVPDILR
jgi:hypothetical protein